MASWHRAPESMDEPTFLSVYFEGDEVSTRRFASTWEAIEAGDRTFG